MNDKKISINIIPEFGDLDLVEQRIKDWEINLDSNKDKLNKNIYNTVSDILVTIDLMLDELKNTTIDFTFDYSGIIILYCKAIEIIELEKTKNLEKEISKIIKSYTLSNRDGKLVIPSSLYLDKMVDKTKILGEDISLNDKDPGTRFMNIFTYQKVARIVQNYLRYGLKGDLYSWNTLLFLFFTFSGKIDENKFHMFRKIYYIYHFFRSGAAHTKIMTQEELSNLENLLYGNNSIEESLIYKLMYNL